MFGATQHSTLKGTLYGNSRPGLASLPATGPLLCSSQAITNFTHMVTDIGTMAKVIPNVPLKLQQRIIQGEFIDLSELLQVDFQFKYASIDSSDALELVHKDETMLMWPRKKGRQIDCLSTWLLAWALYKQVMVYTYPQRYSKLAFYRNFIIQDKKFIWSAVQMFNIRFHAMCTRNTCPLTTMDQALMATILDATVVKTSAHKCFWCGGFDHLVEGCPFPKTALLEMVEIVKKGVQVRQAVKSGPSKSTSPMQLDKWFYNGREGCNNIQLDKCTFPHCKWAHVCHNCKQ